MFKSNNQKIVSDGARMTFVARATGSRFEIIVRFVGHTSEELGGASVCLAQGATWPEGTFFHSSDATEARATLGPGVVVRVAKGATCSVTDRDGKDYGLFRVDLVDPGIAATHGRHEPGGVLYFHSTPSVPLELGGEGSLIEDPTRHLE